MNNTTAAQYALLARAAENMFQAGTLSPPLDPLASGWSVLGYLSAANALLGAQEIGLGDRVYYGFVARSNSDPMQLVAVVRGTEQTIEWLENIEGFLVGVAPKGLVEEGFWSIYRSMQYDAGPGNDPLNRSTAPADLIARIPAGATITVIGHSLGAALATYLMADLARIDNRTFKVRGALFASPRPGNSAFVEDVDSHVGKDNYTAYAYIRDIVPHVPPSLPLPFGLSFQSLPNTVWLKPATVAANIANNPGCNHSALSYAAMLDYSTVTEQRCILSRNETKV